MTTPQTDEVAEALELLSKIQGLLVLSNAERTGSSINDTHDLDELFKPIRSALTALTPPAPIADSEKQDRYWASIAMIRANRKEADKLLTRHTVDDCLEALEAALSRAELAQRRRRVFVVGYLGDWRPAAAVLFEPESLQGHSAPRREKGKAVAGTLSARTDGGGGLGTDFELGGGLLAYSQDVAHCLETTCDDYSRADGFNMIACHGTQDPDCLSDMAHTLGRNSGQENAIAYAIQERAVCENPMAGPDGMGVKGDGTAYTLEARETPQAVAYGVAESPDLAHCLRAGASKADKHESTTYIQNHMAVRRLTPIECERLQGFPDNYTRINDKTADGPRYKALGNSWAVPVVRWIGERIQKVDDIMKGTTT